jgi:hypothetical protein
VNSDACYSSQTTNQGSRTWLRFPLVPFLYPRSEPGQQFSALGRVTMESNMASHSRQGTLTETSSQTNSSILLNKTLFAITSYPQESMSKLIIFTE